MTPIRVVHYLNQFFAGVGGEKKADIAPAVRRGPVGPGVPLQAALGDAGSIVATVYCGDDYASTNAERALDEIVKLVADQGPHVVVTGPAFASGRYGVVCGAVARAVQERLQIPAVAAMSAENPGVELHRRAVPIIPTGDSPARTAQVVAAMARLVLHLVLGEPLDGQEAGGLRPQGIRKNVLHERVAAERVVDLLLAKLGGETYTSEIPFPRVEPPSVARPLGDLARATIALVSSGGVVPRGNPDRIEARRASRWSKFPIAGLDDLTSSHFECIHGGFDNALVAEDPDRVLPVDVMRELEREKVIGRLYEYCYTTVGAGAPIERAARFGREIGEELLAAGVEAVILTAT